MTKATQNNLFSITTKFTLSITQSRYRFCLIGLFLVAIINVFLVNFPLLKRAENYLLIITLLVFSLIFIGVANSKKCTRKLLRSCILTNAGIVSFSDEQYSYQILSSSRYSFFGCWLVMKISTSGDNHTLSETSINTKVKTYFIYRDSLNGQDFARLIKVLKSLH